VLQLVKFETWTAYTLIGGLIPLPGMGTSAHTLKLTFQTNSIAAYFDGVLKTNVTDGGSIDGQPAYTKGTIGLDMYTDATAYTMTVDNVIVSALATVANNDSYTAAKNTALHVAAPGVVANDSGGSGSLTALLISNPSNGSVTLTNNGGFTYTPANNFTGVDSFSYKATDGRTTSSVATVTLTVNNLPVANNDSYAVAENTILTVGPPGILANDAGGSGSLTAILGTGPANGSLTLTNTGGFRYTPNNGFVGTDSFTYQATDGQTTSGVATVTITVNARATANNDTYSVSAGTILNVPAPGVLANDVSSGGTLTAFLANSALHGNLSLSSNGSFSYQPTNGFTGIDGFTYSATDGQTTSAVATVTIEVIPPGALFFDAFTRSTDPGPLSPWIQFDGTWAVTGGMLTGTSQPQSYGHVYLNGAWTNYTVQGQFQFSSTSGWGGGLGARLNAATGARYAAWVYPDSSPGGSDLLVLYKFSTWTAYTEMQQANLPPVGTGGHLLELTLQGSRILVYYDGNQMMDVTDNGTFDGQAAFLGGGITEEIYTATTPFTMFADNVVVYQGPVSADDNYTTPVNTPLTVRSPGVLTNDTDSAGRSMIAILVSGPTNGTLSFNTNGSFVYMPLTNYVGFDTFVYKANDGTADGNDATATLNVIPSGLLFSDNFSRPTDPGALTPWVVQSGTWTITGGVMQGSGAAQSYSYSYINTNWADYTLQGQVMFSSTSQWGAGLGGRLNAGTGAHYAAWVYPENSGGGSAVLKLIKFSSWTAWTLMQQVSLPGVGTTAHTVQVTFAANQILVSYDGIQVMSATDNSAPYLSGGITLDIWTLTSGTMTFDNVSVAH